MGILSPNIIADNGESHGKGHRTQKMKWTLELDKGLLGFRASQNEGQALGRPHKRTIAFGGLYLWRIPYSQEPKTRIHQQDPPPCNSGILRI